MQTYGITGSIASGKSTVAHLLEQYWPVIDADVVARDVVAVNSEGLAAVVAAFGPEILQQDGSLDRVKLRGLIAAQASAQQQLNQIMHPRIADMIVQQLRTLAEQGCELAFVSAALMLETGSYQRYGGVILVCAPETVRFQRLLARDHMDETSARQLMARQMPDAKKRGYTDLIIENDSTLEALEARTRSLMAGLGWPLP